MNQFTKNDLDDSKPISPQKLKDERLHNNAARVVPFINALLRKKFGGNWAILERDTVDDTLTQGLNLSANDLLYGGYLDFEPLYRETGWDVKYVKQEVGDNTPSHWIFTPKTS